MQSIRKKLGKNSVPFEVGAVAKPGPNEIVQAKQKKKKEKKGEIVSSVEFLLGGRVALHVVAVAVGVRQVFQVEEVAVERQQRHGRVAQQRRRHGRQRQAVLLQTQRLQSRTLRHLPVKK